MDGSIQSPLTQDKLRRATLLTSKVLDAQQLILLLYARVAFSDLTWCSLQASLICKEFLRTRVSIYRLTKNHDIRHHPSNTVLWCILWKITCQKSSLSAIINTRFQDGVREHSIRIGDETPHQKRETG